MKTQASFSLLMEMDIYVIDTNAENQRTKKNAKGQFSNESADLESPSHLSAYFKTDPKLVTDEDKFRWVSPVLKMAPFNKTEGALELKINRNNIYVQCMNEKIHTIITATGAAGEILKITELMAKDAALTSLCSMS